MSLSIICDDNLITCDLFGPRSFNDKSIAKEIPLLPNCWQLLDPSGSRKKEVIQKVKKALNKIIAIIAQSIGGVYLNKADLIFLN